MRLQFKEAVSDALSKVGFRPRSVDSPEDRAYVPEHREFVPDEYPLHLVVSSGFGQNAEQGEILTIDRLILRAMSNRGKYFWHPDLEQPLKDPQQLLASPDTQTYLRAFELIKRTVDKNVADRRGYVQSDFLDNFRETGKRGVTLLLPYEEIKATHPSLRKLIELANIQPLDFKYLDSYAKVPVEFWHFSKGGRESVGIQIGTFTDDDTHSQTLSLEIRLASQSSEINLSFFKSSFKLSKELLEYLLSLKDTNKRARLFASLTNFFVEKFDNSNTVRGPWGLELERRSRPVKKLQAA